MICVHFEQMKQVAVLSVQSNFRKLVSAVFI